ncbi:GNAT family N-acetyltransferase [Haliangium sp.]|uniref:GNAT family N-acetyltransferase n=1 Tax=Haliangium sp. TaxID=2663208 RepID=UPI003D0B362C
MPVDIITLRSDNVSVLDHVADDVFDEPIKPERVAAYVTEPGHIMLVAVLDGVVIGQVMAVIHRHPDKATELYIDDLAVAPPFQRRGIATRMIEDVCALGKQRGCKEVWLTVDPDNEQGQRFYESLGLDERIALMFERTL